MVVALLGGGGLGLVALCVGQMAYQLASMLLVFYRREGLLALAMAPAVAAGCCYVAVTFGLVDLGADAPVAGSPGAVAGAGAAAGAAAGTPALGRGRNRSCRGRWRWAPPRC